MAFARTLLFLLGALSVLLLGAVAPGPAQAEPAPCHEMAGMSSETPAPSSERPIKSMGCCIACIAASIVAPPDGAGPVLRPPSPQPAVRALPSGRRLSPETGPPKA
jgi:hypothetical protein